MSAHVSDLASVVQRLERLERQNRWLKVAGAAAVLLLGVAALTGAQRRAEGSEARKELVLRDEKGTERIWLGLDKDGPVLRFRDDAGKDRVALRALKDAAGLVFYDGEGRRRAALASGEGGVSLLSYDRSGGRKAWLVLGGDVAALHARGEKGGQHSGLSVEAGGVAVWYHDEAGKVFAGETGLKHQAGTALHGELVDPLFKAR